MTQTQVVDEIYRRAVARGDKPLPGLCPVAVSRHENKRKRPGPYYRAWYCEVYRATPAELGFLALPGEDGHPDDVDRRDFLAGAAGFMVSLALPVPRQLGQADIERLRESVVHLYKLDDLYGAGSVYAATACTFQRLHSLVEHACYDQATGQALRALAAETAQHAGWLAFDADQHDGAQRWWFQALKWARLADADSVSTRAMALMAWQASDQRPREAIDLATTAQTTAPTPRAKSLLLAREALGHGGAGDATSAHAALRRARPLANQRHDDDPAWLAFYGPANFATHEYRVALILGDFNAAEDGARTALALNDPVAYPRNHALYLTNLANVLVQRRELDEAAAVAKQATITAAGLDSARVTKALRAVTESLDQPGQA